MKNVKVAIILLALVLALNSQSVYATPYEEWLRTYGLSGGSTEKAEEGAQTSDGGYIIVGSTNSAGNYDIWLVKTNSTGGEQWNKTYGGGSLDMGFSVMQTSDGGYIVLGITMSYGAGSTDAWLIKTDSSGVEQWNQTYGGGFADYGYSVRQISSLGYIIAGESDGVIWLVETDNVGAEVWSKTYISATAYSVKVTADDGYIVTGGDEGGAFLLKTDFAGVQEWYNESGIFGESGLSVIQTSDGGYAFVGQTINDAWLVKTNSTGGWQWSKTYGTGELWDLQQLPDGSYIMGGIYNTNDAWLVKADASGVEQWNIAFDGGAADEGHSVIVTSDLGYALVGYREVGNYDALLIKVKSQYLNYFIVDAEPNPVCEGEAIATVAVIDPTDEVTLNGIQFYVRNATYNGTAVNGYNDSGYWYPASILHAPPLAAYNETLQVVCRANLTTPFGYENNETPFNLTNDKIVLSNNSIEWVNYTTLTFTVKDEDSGDIINASMASSWDIHQYGYSVEEHYGFNNSGNTTPLHVFNVTPNRTYEVDSTVEFSATDYISRSYLISGGIINTITQNVVVYLSKAATNVTFLIREATGTPAEGITLVIQKFDPATNTYIGVETLVSDFEGKCYAHLEMGHWYKLILSRDGTIVKTISQVYINTNSYVITLDTITGEYYDYQGALTYSIAYENATRTLRVTVTDTSGLMTSVNLKIQKKGLMNWTTIYNNTEAGNSITMLYTFTNETATYTYSVSAAMQSSSVLLGTGIIEIGRLAAAYGSTGLILAALLIALLALAAIWSPSACIGLSIVGVIMAWLMKLMSLELIAVVALLVGGAILVYKIKV